jgi:hypothetical protein
MRTVLDKHCWGNQNTHVLCSITFLRKSYRLWDIVKHFSGATEAGNDNAIWRICVEFWISKATCAHAHSHAHAPGHPRTRAHKEIRTIYCFSTATMVSGTHLNVALYVHCLYCYTFLLVLWISKMQGVTMAGVMSKRSEHWAWET